MEFSIIHFLVISFLLYNIAPTIIIRFGNIGALSRARAGGARVALTFDDGPDPRYTPQILEILGRYQVKACFFVIGRQARAYPDLIRQIISAGHEIGNHGFSHRVAWFLTPPAVTREIIETTRAIEELTGQKTRYCRPAWGLFNIFSVCYCRLKGFKVILWTYMSWDWIKKTTPEGITSKVLGRLKDGAILVFHDGDSAPGAAHGAPAKVVAALPKILEGVRDRGLKIVPIAEIEGDRPRRGLFAACFKKAWGLLEPFIRRVSGIKEVQEMGNSIFRLALRTYRGKDWQLPGEVMLVKGNRYLELHLNNERLASLLETNTSTERMALIALREVKSGLPPLAGLLRDDPRYRDIKAVLAITLLHRGCERLGFSTYEIKGILRPFTSMYESWLLGLYHPGGFKQLKKYRGGIEPKYVVMTRQELLSRYRPQ
ncbi:MAG: polysaccharide deacetylase family protein [Eubacteriales bacterium]